MAASYSILAQNKKYAWDGAFDADPFLVFDAKL